MCGKIDCYKKAFSRLRVEKDKERWSVATSYRAPHKPFLLLSILDLVSQHKITREFVEISTELDETFNGYWQKTIPSETNTSIGYPFYHMGEESFWTLVPRRGTGEPEGEKVYSLQGIREYYLGARMDAELFPLLLMEPLRRKLRQTILVEYFAQDLHPILLELSK